MRSRQLRGAVNDGPGRPGAGVLRRLHNDERGVAAVEMAIVLPVLIMLVFGIIQFGIAYNSKLTMTHAAREGVRVLAVEEDTGKAYDAVVVAAGSYADSDLSIGTYPCSGTSPAQVTVSRPHNLEIPLVGTWSLTLKGSASMTCG